MGRTHKRFYQGNVGSGVRTRDLDDVNCEGVTYSATGVKDRPFTQPRVILITVNLYDRGTPLEVQLSVMFQMKKKADDAGLISSYFLLHCSWCSGGVEVGFACVCACSVGLLSHRYHRISIPFLSPPTCLCVVRCSLFIVRCSLFVVRCSLLVADYKYFAALFLRLPPFCVDVMHTHTWNHTLVATVG